MRQNRKIIFDLTLVNECDLNHIGIYKITNLVNKHFYIGSSDRSFKERFKEHCRLYEMYVEDSSRRIIHPILWRAYKKYGIENFQVSIIEILDGKTYFEILKREEYYIQNLNPEYNICKFPTAGGKPNLGRKLSNKWKKHIKEKSNNYKHNTESLKLVIKNNKNNAVKLKFIKESENMNLIHGLKLL